MSALYFVRHGQASLGAARYDQLSELGVRQASATGKYLAEVIAAPTRVVIGPRDRHRATCAGIAAAFSSFPTVEETVQLDEMAEAEQLAPSGDRTDYLGSIDAWARGTLEAPGVATAAAFRARVTQWLAAVTMGGPRKQRIVAVTSAGVIAMAATHVLGLETSAVAHLIRTMRNASITELVFSARGVALVGFNSVGHLPAGWVTGI